VFGEHSSSPNGEENTWLGAVDFDSPAFDWGGVTPPGIPDQDVVIYEMTTRAFTMDESSGIAPGRRGSFLAIADKVDHLKELGVNAVAGGSLRSSTRPTLNRRPEFAHLYELSP